MYGILCALYSEPEETRELRATALELLENRFRTYAVSAGNAETCCASIKLEAVIRDWEGGIDSPSAKWCISSAVRAEERGASFTLEAQRKRVSDSIGEALDWAYASEEGALQGEEEEALAVLFPYSAAHYEAQEAEILELLKPGGELEQAMAKAVADLRAAKRNEETREKRLAALSELLTSPEAEWAEQNAPELLNKLRQAVKLRLPGKAQTLLESIRYAREQEEAMAGARTPSVRTLRKEWEALLPLFKSEIRSLRGEARRYASALLRGGDDDLAQRLEEAKAILAAIQSGE